jgi:hypothetical protein
MGLVPNQKILNLSILRSRAKKLRNQLPCKWSFYFANGNLATKSYIDFEGEDNEHWSFL